MLVIDVNLGEWFIELAHANYVLRQSFIRIIIAACASYFGIFFVVVLCDELLAVVRFGSSSSFTHALHLLKQHLDSCHHQQQMTHIILSALESSYLVPRV